MHCWKGWAFSIQLMYPRYLLEDLFPCCAWYFEPLRSSPNAGLSTFIFSPSLSLPQCVIRCQQTRMKKNKKDGNLLEKNPFSVFVDPAQRPHHCFTFRRLLPLLCREQSWHKQTCPHRTGCHISRQRWASTYSSPGALAAAGLFPHHLTALSKWNSPWGDVFPGRAFCIQRKVFKHREGSEMRIGFPPGGAFCGRTQQLRSCSLSFQLPQVPGRSSLGGDQAMGRHLTTQSAPQEANPAVSDVLTLCAQLNRTYEVTPCTPSRRSPSWRSKKEKTWGFVFPLGFFFFFLNDYYQKKKKKKASQRA